MSGSSRHRIRGGFSGHGSGRGKGNFHPISAMDHSGNTDNIDNIKNKKRNKKKIPFHTGVPAADIVLDPEFDIVAYRASQLEKETSSKIRQEARDKITRAKAEEDRIEIARLEDELRVESSRHLDFEEESFGMTKSLMFSPADTSTPKLSVTELTCSPHLLNSSNAKVLALTKKISSSSTLSDSIGSHVKMIFAASRTKIITARAPLPGEFAWLYDPANTMGYTL